MPVVHGDPRFGPDDGGWRRPPWCSGSCSGSAPPTVWLEASSEEGRSLHLLVTAESARRLADAMAALLAVL